MYLDSPIMHWGQFQQITAHAEHLTQCAGITKDTIDENKTNTSKRFLLDNSAEQNIVEDSKDAKII